MIKNFDRLLNNYAELTVKRGLNFPIGAYVEIDCDIDQPDFIHLLVKTCYKYGAKRVWVKFTFSSIYRTQLKMTNHDALLEFPDYRKKKMISDIKNEVYKIYVESEDPFYLDDINPKKISAANHHYSLYRRELEQKFCRIVPYTIITVPSKAWAKRLFPKLNINLAIEKLWKLIFACSHVDDSSNAFKAWDDHCVKIDRMADCLNKLNIVSLHYKNKLGTDLYLGLPDKYLFAGTPDYDIKKKRNYYSNIPTEEVFCAPHKDKVNGVVYASMPLSYDGKLIENIKLEFRDGKVIKYSATKNLSSLKSILETDEGSSRLGEVALVPYSSPIRKCKTLFLNTLFDENASCHFALGCSYSYTYPGFQNMSREQLIEKGMNFSVKHVDFMIGTKDLKIDAKLKDGSTINIFNNGEWNKKL